MRAGLLAFLLLTTAGPAGAVTDVEKNDSGAAAPAALVPADPAPEGEAEADPEGESVDEAKAEPEADGDEEAEAGTKSADEADTKAAAKKPTLPVPPLSETICPMIEAAAAVNGLPVGFFTRLIWQESSFRAQVVSSAGAQGVAQFMPATAAERGLADPLDPASALPESAELLRDLRTQFGNLGLAAAAYNAGPRRVQDWLAGLGGLPSETRHYVRVVTGRPADEWVTLGDDPEKTGLEKTSADCRHYAALAAARPAPAVGVISGDRSAGPWGVQISGNFSKKRALAAFASTKRKYRDVLGEHDPMIIRARLKSRGPRPYYRVRIGMKTRDKARALCNKLREAGGACVVLRN